MAIELDNYILESLVPATLILEEDCKTFFCCENETANQKISDLAGMLASMGLRESAKPLPGESIFFAPDFKTCNKHQVACSGKSEPFVSKSTLWSLVQPYLLRNSNHCSKLFRRWLLGVHRGYGFLSDGSRNNYLFFCLCNAWRNSNVGMTIVLTARKWPISCDCSGKDALAWNLFARCVLLFVACSYQQSNKYIEEYVGCLAPSPDAGSLPLFLMIMTLVCAEYVVAFVLIRSHDSCFPVLQILALLRRISEDSSTSEFERACCLMARTFARLLDEVLYLLTDLERGDGIPKGSIVRVYDAVLHRYVVSQV